MQARPCILVISSFADLAPTCISASPFGSNTTRCEGAVYEVVEHCRLMAYIYIAGYMALRAIRDMAR